MVERADMMLPEPTLSFTIPSIHDDATLECRIFHPQSLSANPGAPTWRKHSAIIAHPYAPLGGCYDDPVVETVSGTLLRQGFLVGTFNFRGAGNSTGRTSWTSKAERSDYMSFVGFICYYLHYLDPFSTRPHLKSPTSLPSSPTATQPAPNLPTAQPPEPPVLLLCGYSYGAMITKLLPPFDSVVEPFNAPPTASAAADIRLRAQHLAEKQNVILASARVALLESQNPVSPRKAAFGLRVGGDEDKRRSQDNGVRRSFSIDAEEKIRKGVAELMNKAKSRQLHHHRKKKVEQENGPPAVKEVEGEEEREPEALSPVGGLVTPSVAYLLISPPVGWATNLMTMNFSCSISNMFGKLPKSPKRVDKKGKDPPPEAGSKYSSLRQEKQKLVENPTLAIYGDSDVFVAVKKFREWASKLQTAPGSKFRAHEVSTAGHFYIEDGTMQRLADAVRVFSGVLLAQTNES